MSHIVILGNGISGITAARHLRKRSDARITIVSGETDHFFSRTALMYVYMGHMRYENIKPYEDWFWAKNRLELKRGWVETVDFEAKTLQFQGGDSLSYDKLVLATGSKPNKFGWPGQDATGVQGLYSFQDLESMEAATTKDLKRAVIVGGGLIGIEMAEMFRSRGIEVTMLVRETSFWNNVLPAEESAMVNHHIKAHHIDLRLKTELDSILTTSDNRVRGVKTKGGAEIECQFVGLTVGVSPNIGFLKGGALEIDRGILINEFLETNLPDVYALGDCAQHRTPPAGRRPVEQVWYTGRMMGEAVARTLAGEKTSYQPGPWFNSAKFLDIEYQIYGDISASPKENEAVFYHEAPCGKKAIRIVYEKDSHKLVGLNLMGVRYRHEVADHWLRKGATMQEVLPELHKANFDPEFFPRHEQALLGQYNAKHPDRPVKKRGKLRARLETLLSA